MKQETVTPLLKCFAADSRDWLSADLQDSLNGVIPSWVIKGGSKNLHVSFEFQGGTPATRVVAWQAIHVFSTHKAATPMPAGIAYPGVLDPGVGVALPLVCNSCEGIIHLLASLTCHPSGMQARGAQTELLVTIAEQPVFSISF